MKVLQTINSMSVAAGGIATCTYDLVSFMQEGCYKVDLVSFVDCKSQDCLLGQGEPWLIRIPQRSTCDISSWVTLQKFLTGSEYELFHTNGLWTYINHETCKIARRKHLPYLITPHGMLYPEALARSYWKKRIALDVAFKKDIMESSCLHATCVQEMEFLRAIGYGGPVAVIPNPANLPEYLAQVITNRKNQNIKVFGFLGRLHPRKRVENILYAASLIKENAESYEIDIIGSGNPEYENFLRSEVKRLRLNNVRFRGFLKGREKFEALAAMTCLFVPSDFENFGMIITEALSVETPVVASTGTPWEDLNENQCGWWCDCNPEMMAKIMKSILDMSEDTIRLMGENGRKLVIERYSPLSISSQMRGLYDYILNGGPKPSFIYSA